MNIQEVRQTNIQEIKQTNMNNVEHGEDGVEDDHGNGDEPSENVGPVWVVGVQIFISVVHP